MLQLKQVDKKFLIFVKNSIFFFLEENDVLGRFNESVRNIQNANIIRVCADNPFIDPIEVDNLIFFFNKNKYDYVCNHQNKLKVDMLMVLVLKFYQYLLKKLNKIVKEKI